MYSTYCLKDCKEKIVLTEESFTNFIPSVETAFQENISFIDDFISLSEQGNLDEESMKRMLYLLNITAETDVESLHNYNIENGVCDLMDQQSSHLNLRALPPSGGSGDSGDDYCNKLVEIRNALIKECDLYVIGIDEVCSAAVMVAYWWKSRDC